jgi:hypothetical protein
LGKIYEPKALSVSPIYYDSVKVEHTALRYLA